MLHLEEQCWVLTCTKFLYLTHLPASALFFFFFRTFLDMTDILMNIILRITTELSIRFALRNTQSRRSFYNIENYLCKLKERGVLLWTNVNNFLREIRSPHIICVYILLVNIELSWSYYYVILILTLLQTRPKE